jgi:hypothetical protein
MVKVGVRKEMEIKLPCGATALIDEEDAWTIEVFPWWRKVRSHVRVKRTMPNEFGVWKQDIYLHRLIMFKIFGAHILGFEIDHINRNGLDNRRSNLRLASRGENAANKSKAKGASSKYRGVAWRQNNRKNPWVAYISKNNRRIDLGYFATEELAAAAYDKKAAELWGSFAYRNLPDKN